MYKPPNTLQSPNKTSLFNIPTYQITSLLKHSLYPSLFLHPYLLTPGLSEYTYPEGYKLSFPARTNYMYAVVQHPIPELRAFTVCLWLRPTEGGIGTPFSYAVVEQPNELVLLQGMHTPVELLINDKVMEETEQK